MITFDDIPAAEFKSTNVKLLVLIRRLIENDKITYEIGYYTVELDDTLKLIEVSIVPKREIK